MTGKGLVVVPPNLSEPLNGHHISSRSFVRKDTRVLNNIEGIDVRHLN